jgi:hypothetical protein
MKRLLTTCAGIGLLVLALWLPAAAASAECSVEPRSACFGIESVEASLSTNQAGAHPDLTLAAGIKQDPASEPNVFGLHNSYAATRNIRFQLPPGLIGDPNVLGRSQQCQVAELLTFNDPGGGCPNGSQIGTGTIRAYSLEQEFHEPVYMMTPPGGDVVARLGTIAGVFPTFIDIRVRSQSDYGLVAEISDATAAANLISVESHLWGVPAAPVHDTDRCTPKEAFGNCVTSESRPPGSRPLPFLTNPTRCGIPLPVGIDASSWLEPGLDPAKEVSASLGPITGCNSLPFGPSLEAEPTSHHTSAPTGLDLTIKLPASEGTEVLEPSQIRYMRIDFPPGLAIDNGAADGLGVCSAAEAGFERNEASHCSDDAKLAATEFEVPVLERNLKGAIYLREPEPGDPFRIWILADDLGLHLKLPGDLQVDKSTGQVHSIVLGAPELEGIPQAPLREVKLLLKSGFRAPLITPDHCGTFYTHYEFVPWSGGPPAVGQTPMQITEGCDTGGFSPELQAGSAQSQAGSYSPFRFTITRSDGEQNIQGLSVTLPRGLTASFRGVARCEGASALSGNCPADSRVGSVVAAIGAGPQPLWIPQAGKRPTAVYLSGPYKGAPLSIIAVVPKQAGPFDFGDEVVRSAIYVDPSTADVTAVADPLPQFVEGIPLLYKTLHVELDRPHFSLNPTSCGAKQTRARLTSAAGAVAQAGAPYAVTDCARLPFKPTLSLSLHGSVKRAGNPALTAKVKMPAGGANIASAQVTLPHSEFLDQAHVNAPCTRVQFREGGGFGERCPGGALIGHAAAKTPLFDFPLSGPVYLRSNPAHTLPDIVAVLRGPAQMPIAIELAGRVDSAHGGIRNTFELIPDAPVEEFTLALAGGKKGLLENSPPGTGNTLCAIRGYAAARFTGQNGKRVTLHPELRTLGCRTHHHKGHGSHKGQR